MAVALIFAGALLGAAIPRVGLRRRSGSSAMKTAPRPPTTEPAGQLDVDLQEEIFEKLEATYYKPIDPDILNRSCYRRHARRSERSLHRLLRPPRSTLTSSRTTSGSYSGVGMVLMMNDRLPTVVSVFEGSRQRRHGIQAGRHHPGGGQAPAHQGRTLDEVVADIKGAEGTKVQLELYRPAVPITTTALLVAEEGTDATTDTTDAEVAAETLTIDLTRAARRGASARPTRLPAAP